MRPVPDGPACCAPGEALPLVPPPGAGLSTVAARGGAVATAALDLARDGVTVNAVCPGVTDTPLLRGRLATLPNGDEELAAYAARHPLGRVLTARDIANAIAFLSAPAAAGITGIALPVDAGLGATWDAFRDPSWVSPAR